LTSIFSWLFLIFWCEPSLAFICQRDAWIFIMAVSSVVNLATIICQIDHNPVMHSIQSHV
jgi:hypothetical protein